MNETPSESENGLEISSDESNHDEVGVRSTRGGTPPRPGFQSGVNDSEPKLEAIAIIGMVGRVPGAKTLTEFWEMLRDGREGITRFSREALLADGTPPETLDDPSFVPLSSILSDADQFDAEFFGISPNEAQLMDPQGRIFLEIAQEALETAGYAPDLYAGSIGVFAGAAYNTYFLNNVVTNPEVMETMGAYPVMLLNDKDYLATRTSYKLNLRGPSFTVQTACSTSLVAIHQACQSLLSYGCDLALAGGVAVHSPRARGYLYEEGMIFSPDGKCRPFDADAKGTVPGEGAGVVVLKRLSEAIADGDTIDAVILGSAINNDGANKVGFSAPSVAGQAEVIATAQAVSGVLPETISYVEAHGTGTLLGDPIELAGLTQAFRLSTDGRQFCALGSVKANLGHSDAAAGVVGLIKTVLCLQHKTLVPTPHFVTPNPRFDFANSPFFVTTETREWTVAEGQTRRAGISSFGIGGTNAHLILEEAPALPPTSAPSHRFLPLVYSHKVPGREDSPHTKAQRDEETKGNAQCLTPNALADAAYTLAMGRNPLPYRGFTIVDTQHPTPNTQHPTPNTPTPNARVAFLFPGQGAQFAGMGRALYETESDFRTHIDECAEFLKPMLGADLREMMFPASNSEAALAEANERLKETRFAQPALFIVALGVAKLWLKWGVKPDAMLGHSVGEYAAACLAGVLTLEEALTLIATRGNLMGSVEPGGMLAVRLSANAVREILPETLEVATDNAPELCTVSGDLTAIDAFVAECEAREIGCQKLHTSHAFHSRMMEPILAEFTQTAAKLSPKPPYIPYLSNVTGDWITETDLSDPAYWGKHLRGTVRFREGIEKLLSRQNYVFLEVGSGQTLTQLVRQFPEIKAQTEGGKRVFSSLAHAKNLGQNADNDLSQMAHTLGELWTAGIEIDWNGYFAGETRRRIPLPTTVFNRKRYWLDKPNPVTDAKKVSADEKTSKLDVPQNTNLRHLDSSLSESETPDKSREIQTMIQETPFSQNGGAPVTNGKASSPPFGSPPEPSRVPRLLTEVKQVAQKVSGMNAAEMHEESDFLMIGFDSLLLVQLSQAFRKKFGVKLSLNQLMEEISTPAAVARYLDHTLPADPVTENKPENTESIHRLTPINTDLSQQQNTQLKEQVAAVPTPQLVAQDNAQRPTPNAPFPMQMTPMAMPQMPSMQMMPPMAMPGMMPMASPDAWMAYQMQLQQWQQFQQFQQFQAMMSGSPGVGYRVSGQEVMPPALPQTPGENSPLSLISGSEREGSGVRAFPNTQHPTPGLPDSYKGKEAMGPFRPVQKTDPKTLTERQRAYLEAFTQKFVAKTQGSKRQTDADRPYLADPRVVVGFRKHWKELVYPIVAERSQGSRIWDVDGNEYIDLVMGFGCYLLGYNPEILMEPLHRQLDLGWEIGPQSPIAGKVAKLVYELTGLPRVAMMNTGSEAVMTAIRLARTITGREKIIVFTGAYHGNFDSVALRQKPTNGERPPYPISAGIPDSLLEDMILVEYGSPEALEVIRREMPNAAAVLCEAIQSRNMSLQPFDFLRQVKRLCEEHDSCFILDDLVMGFRVAPNGSIAYHGIEPDIVTYGKVVGGGMPIGVIAGHPRWMDAIDGGKWNFGDDSYPEAEMTFYAGCFCKHPLSMIAALVLLTHIKEQGMALYQDLERRTARAVTAMNDFFHAEQIPISIEQVGSIFRFLYPSDFQFVQIFLAHMVYKGVHLWEGRNAFVSTAHTDADLDYVVRAVKESVYEMRDGGFFPERRGAIGGMLNAQHPTPNTLTPLRETGFFDLSREEKPPGKSSLRFSLYFFGNYPAEYTESKYRLFQESVQFADEHGFESVWLPERHFHSFGGLSPNPAVLAASLANGTKQLKIRGGSVVLPLHNPIRVAEEWALVDNLSGGRVAISFATGWNANDFALAPERFEERKQLTRDGRKTVEALWRGESIPTSNGKGETIPVRIFPAPVQKTLPAWLSGVSLETFIEAGETGANVLTNLQSQTIPELAEKIKAYREARARNGYDTATGCVTVLMHTLVKPNAEDAQREARLSFYHYMHASMELMSKRRGEAEAADLDAVDEEELEMLFGNAYTQYVESRAFIGSPDTCAKIADALIAAGVNEVGCLLDFIEDSDLALSGLEALDALRQHFSGSDSSPDPDLSLSPSRPVLEIAPQSLPLSEAQSDIWLAAQLDPNATLAYNEDYTLQLANTLDVDKFREAVNTVIARHDILRAQISLDGSRQKILPTLTLDLPVETVTERAHLTQILEAEATTGFNLQNAPLFRARLFQISPPASLETQRQREGESLTEEAFPNAPYLFSFAFHHILLDDHSGGLFFMELSAIYSALVNRETPELDAPMPFAEYLAWLKSDEYGLPLAQSELYWTERHATEAFYIELPTDRPRPALKTYACDHAKLNINADLLLKLKRTAATQKVTLFHLLSAGFYTLLHRLTGETDVTTGIVASGQSLIEDYALMGHAANLLPVRISVDPEAPFAQLLATVKSSVVEAYNHQHLMFGSLVRRLNRPLDKSRVALTGIVFNIDKLSNQIAFENCESRFLDSPRLFSRYDLFFNLLQSDDHLQVHCYYNTDLYDRETVERTLRVFQTLLECLTETPDIKTGDLPLLTNDEARELLDTRNATAVSYPQVSLAELFTETATANPTATALEFGNQRISYAELDRRSNQMARYLQTQGVRPEDRVAVCMERAPEVIFALLGILKAGATYVPIATDDPLERKSRLIREAECRAILTQKRFCEAIPDLGLPTLSLDARAETILKERDTPLESLATPESLAAVMYTSGSTGTPKGVCVPQCAVIRLVKNQNENYVQISREDRFLGFAPFAFDASTFEIWGALLNGATLALYPATSPTLSELGAFIEQKGITILWLTAALFHQMVETELPRLVGVRQLLTGGEAPSLAAFEVAQKSLPNTTLINGYGPTENTTFSVCYRYPKLNSPTDTLPLGVPICNTRAYVLDARLQPLPIGVPGELCLAGDGLATGYLGLPELTAEKFVSGWVGSKEERLYRTGDRAKWRPDGNLEFLGRWDEQIKLRGFRIELGEIETALRAIPGIAEATVVLHEARNGERQLVAYYALSEVTEPLSAEPLRDALRRTLPDYLVPNRFVCLPMLPLKANGKVDKAALPAPDTLLPEADRTSPANETEAKLVALWSEILNVPQLSVTADFFELGGHSLLAVKLFSRIERDFGKRLPLSVLFQHSTVRKLAELLAPDEELSHAKTQSREEKSGDLTPGLSTPNPLTPATTWDCLVPIQPEGERPPFFSVHAVGANVLNYRLLSKHLGKSQPFYGFQAMGLDGNTSPATSVHEMAEHYIAAMKSVQPEGPYFIGGGSSGGIVAFEMAQLLIARNEKVGLLALLDTYCFPEEGTSAPANWERRELIDEHLGNLIELSFGEKVGYLWRASLNKLRALGLRLTGRRLLTEHEAELPPVLRQVRRAILTAIHSYQPDPYPGKVTMFLATKAQHRTQRDPRLRWAEFAEGGFDLQLIPADHDEILEEPHVRTLALRLRLSIDNVMGIEGARD